MQITPDMLLTDEFVDFAQKIITIHAKKKAKKQELKDFYDRIQNEINQLDTEVKEAQEGFDKLLAPKSPRK